MSKEQSAGAVRETVKHMVPAVGIAILSGALGFTALYISPVPMVQDFGKMLKFGVIISFVASILFLLPILFIRDRFFTLESQKKRKGVKSTFEKAMAAVTKTTLKLGPLILTVSLLLTGIGIMGDMKVGVQTDVEKFMPQDTRELHDIHVLREVLGTTDQVVVLFEGEDVTQEKVIRWVEKETESLPKQFPDAIVSAKSVTSILKTMSQGPLPAGSAIQEQLRSIPADQLKMVLTEDHKRGVILLGVKHLGAAEMKDFIGQLKHSLDSGIEPSLKVTVTGKSVLDTEMISALTTGRYKMTFLGIGLVFLVLLLVYRHPIKAFVAILPISLIVGWSGGLMFVFGYDYTPLTATLGALVIGIGTEFTILIMERFYEEKRKGKGRNEAVVIATQKIGKAILASGLTVIGGFSALIASDFVILSNFGVMTVLNMTLCLVSTLVVLPPTLVLMDKFVKTKVQVSKLERSVV